MIKYDTEAITRWIINVLCGVEDMNEPYKDVKISDKEWIREFDPTIAESEEYVWHRDRNDRIITVLEGEGWKFQFDDELPQIINKADKLFVPKMMYHRLLIGNTILKIHIEEIE